MDKDVPRYFPDGFLCHGCKDRVSKFLKGSGSGTGQAVSDEKGERNSSYTGEEGVGRHVQLIDNVFEEERDLNGNELGGDKETHGDGDTGFERGSVMVKIGGGPEVLSKRLEDADVAGAFILFAPPGGHG